MQAGANAHFEYAAYESRTRPFASILGGNPNKTVEDWEAFTILRPERKLREINRFELSFEPDLQQIIAEAEAVYFRAKAEFLKSLAAYTADETAEALKRQFSACEQSYAETLQRLWQTRMDLDTQ